MQNIFSILSMIALRLRGEKNDFFHQNNSDKEPYLFLYAGLAFLFSICLFAWWSIELIIFTFLMVLICLAKLCTFTYDNYAKTGYVSPWVPVLPMLSLVGNAYLAVYMGFTVWCYYIFWMIMTFFIYYFYGKNNSILERLY